MPTGRLMSVVLTAMLRSGVRFPKALLTAWARLDVMELPSPQPCFIEDLVGIARERRPVHATVRNTRTVAFGGLGQCKRRASAHQIAHAADGVADGPTADGLVTAPSPEGG
jgi:hypothetical protein